MTETLTRRLIEAAATRVIAAADELTALDRLTGDGDHGTNLKRGCEAVLAQIDRLAERPLPDALRATGHILQATVGGASGPLYGALLAGIGKGLAQDAQRVAEALQGGIVAVERLGKSEPGCKTMLDVLAPVQRLLEDGGADLPARIEAAAAAAAESTVAMKATRGRAAYLGDRSIGHMDPGARTAQIMIAAVCSVLA